MTKKNLNKIILIVNPWVVLIQHGVCLGENWPFNSKININWFSYKYQRSYELHVRPDIINETCTDYHVTRINSTKSAILLWKFNCSFIVLRWATVILKNLNEVTVLETENNKKIDLRGVPYTTGR